ncbi:hypothetical protein B0H13DRAFT_1646562, partial [Mycena leptocephala]
FLPQDKSLYSWRQEKVDIYVSELMRLDGWGHANRDWCPGCFAPNPTVRCRDCHGGAIYCEDCVVRRHLENPLHRVYKWMPGGFFEKTPLAALGLRVQLGHPVGKRCTGAEPGNKNFVVLHTNGIHQVNVDFCGCTNSLNAGGQEIQLLRFGWFPATHECPRTAATLTVLDQFHQETIQAKTTMYDFYGVLEKLTNNAGVKLPDRYHEWIRMCREYWHLMLLKRGARAMAYDSSGAQGTKPGELAIECPACPRPGINLPEGWEDTPPAKQHLYMLFLAFDACFRLKRRLVSSELKDPGLGTGWAYMVENEPYREYLRTVTDQKEMKTCSGLTALDYANTKFSRSYSSTGMGMGVCARHEFVQPNGVGDLQRGERFANMDWITASILRHKHRELWKVFSYDIVCIWCKHLPERLKKLPPLVHLDLILKIVRFVIPKMHLRAHLLLCQYFFSLNLTCGCAQTDGEGIERPWSFIGALATSTREMGPRARHGVLDCQWSYWNWQKLVGIVALLRRRMDRAVTEYERQKEGLEMFSKEQAEFVPTWKARVDEFEAAHSEVGAAAATMTVLNPYEIKVKGLSEAQVRLQFSKEEAAEVSRGVPSVHDVMASKFVSVGLDLESEQRRVRLQAELKKAGTTGMEIDLVAMRTALSRQLVRFRKLQATYTPGALQVLGDMNVEEDVTVENMPLVLPSALTPAQRLTCRPGLGNIEEMLRSAQCHEALIRLHLQLHIKSRFLIYKGNHARHQGANTRSRSIVARNESKIRLHSEKFQMAWEAIRLLSPDGDPEKVGWPKLKADDIRCMEDMEDIQEKEEKLKRQKARRARRMTELRDHGLLPAEDDGDDDDDEMDVDGPVRRGAENRRQVSWIWTVSGMGGTDADLEDALCIEWSKAYARMNRWAEELDILAAEYVRVMASFEFEAVLWDLRAKAVPIGVIPLEEAEGAIAFARKQAAMFRDLKRRGELRWKEEKLTRGKKRPTQAVPLGLSAMLDREEEGEEEERERQRAEEEDKEELLRSDAASDEEFVMGGEGDDD